jgi:hypothetical protein
MAIKDNSQIISSIRNLLSTRFAESSSLLGILGFLRIVSPIYSNYGSKDVQVHPNDALSFENVPRKQ